MKMILGLVLFLAAVMPAQSLQRVYVSRPAPLPTPSPVSAIAVFPLVFLWIDYHLCDFVAGSVDPYAPPARQKLALGDCPPRATPR